jgi:hypothetical protein
LAAAGDNGPAAIASGAAVAGDEVGCVAAPAELIAARLDSPIKQVVTAPAATHAG